MGRRVANLEQCVNHKRCSSGSQRSARCEGRRRRRHKSWHVCSEGLVTWMGCTRSNSPPTSAIGAKPIAAVMDGGGFGGWEAAPNLAHLGCICDWNRPVPHGKARGANWGAFAKIERGRALPCGCPPARGGNCLKGRSTSPTGQTAQGYTNRENRWAGTHTRGIPSPRFRATLVKRREGLCKDCRHQHRR